MSRTFLELNLKTKKLYMQETYYMYGKHSVLAALNNPKRRIKEILCTAEIFADYSSQIKNFPYKIVKYNILNNLLPKQSTHQGLVANVETIFASETILHEVTKIAECKIAILDQITDAQNIGAIIRNAAAFGINALILPTHHCPAENATIAKIASGALELVTIIQLTNLNQAIKYLKEKGFWIAGLAGEAKQIIETNKLGDKIAIILGSEDKGIRKLIKENCDFLLKIPINKNVESLNVSSASAIAFFILSNQSRTTY